MIEHVINRVLGALRFVDAAAALAGGPQLAIPDPVQVAAAGLTLRRNRRGYYVIARSSHPQLRPHHDQFLAPPAAPPPGSLAFDLHIKPLSRGYLPRAATIGLPRDPDPAAADSLFTPIDLGLYPAPTAGLLPGLGALRVTVRDPSGAPAPAALLRVTAADDANNLMGRGMSDWRGRASGEALVPVTKIPSLGVPANGDGPVLSEHTAIQVQAFVDPGFDPEADLPDPDDLEARRATLAASALVDLEIAAGQTLALVIAISP